MLDIHNHDYHQSVLAFAEEAGLKAQLDERLKYLDEYAENGDRGRTRCRLFKDYAPYSFEFVMERKGDGGQYQRWFNGGLIYHGAHDRGGDGGGPTFAVSLSPINGWSIHT